MIDVVLGIIAFASLTTLVVEIAVAWMLFRAGMSAKARVERIIEMTRGMRTHADTIAADFAKSRALAEKQIERAEEAYHAVMGPLEPLIMAFGIARSVAGVLRGATSDAGGGAAGDTPPSSFSRAGRRGDGERRSPRG